MQEIAMTILDIVQNSIRLWCSFDTHMDCE